MNPIKIILSSVPSPKQEAVEFVEWLNSLETLDLTQFKDPANPTASELYDKFKEKGEKNDLHI